MGQGHLGADAFVPMRTPELLLVPHGRQGFRAA